MSRFNKIFNSVPIDVPNKSGHDLSHTNSGTLKCGTLVPVLVDELLPQDTISLGHLTQLEYPPFVTSFYGKVDVHLEAFFVPNRLIYGGWQSFITHPTLQPLYPTGTPAQNKSKYLPGIAFGNINPSASGTLNPAIFNSAFGPGSLADYLGFKKNRQTSAFTSSFRSVSIPNALPFLAYHKIYNDHYRYSQIQPELFYRPSDSAGIEEWFPSTDFQSRAYSPSVLPYISDSGSRKIWIGVSSPSDLLGRPITFTDGVSLLSLRQRTWFRDYFTSASPTPQSSSQPASVSFDTSGNNGSFSIASLRAANSLQLWLERQNIAGYDYASQIKANFGKYPSSSHLDKSIYLGRSIFNMYKKGVSQTTPNDASGPNNGNPFSSVGARYGQAMSLESSSLVDKFTADEHGFIMVLMSLVPHKSYSSGVSRMFKRSTQSDFAFPLLQGLGEQSIDISEISGFMESGSSDLGTFGYTGLYSEYKFKNDEIHGQLRDGEPLDSFAIQSNFENYSDIELSSDFLLIPENYLDQVKSTTTEVSDLDAWYNIDFQYKKVSCLDSYSIPTLENPKNTHKTTIPKGGQHL